MERKLDNNTRQYLLKTLYLAEGDVLTPELAAEYAMKDDEELVYDLCEIVAYKSKALSELIKVRQNGI
jgi:hypothetical protein